MYIEYVTPQRLADPYFPNNSSMGGEYRPTWLVRTSDWQRVPGTEATDGYHTVSYVWEQSGDITKISDGGYICVDGDYHKIIYSYKRVCSSSLAVSQVYVTAHVVYAKVLQQICKDFDVDYLWYDKICIDQENKEQKHREIKNMHLIYSNARYTIAFIPEINITDHQDFTRRNQTTGFCNAWVKAIGAMQSSLWWRRSWTLEEVMMSTRLLIVGRNTHFWSAAIEKQDTFKANNMLSAVILGYKDRKMKSINQVLRLAHFRTSTKEHDKIYALANILEGVIDVNIDYDVNISTAMNVFYRQLAEHDLSIMCFGSIAWPPGKTQLPTTMDSYNLPSWTGVDGLHTVRPIIDTIIDDNTNGYYIDESMLLHISCKSYTIHPSNNSWNNADYDQAQLYALNSGRAALLAGAGVPPTHMWIPTTDSLHENISPILPLSLTETCSECIILYVIFATTPAVLNCRGQVYRNFCYYLSPIVRQSPHDSTYKVIGTILLKSFKRDEPRIPPSEFLEKMFGQNYNETQEFIIS